MENLIRIIFQFLMVKDYSKHAVVGLHINFFLERTPMIIVTSNGPHLILLYQRHPMSLLRCVILPNRPTPTVLLLNHSFIHMKN